MTFDSKEQIEEIIKTNPAKTMLDAARLESKALKMLITGEGMLDFLEKLPYFEGKTLEQIRNKLTKSVVDLMERVLRARVKIFTAKGGSRTYQMPERQSAELRSILHSITKGLPVQDWIKVFALTAFDTDPMSLTFMEINPETGIPFPTYKSTTDIFDYELNGRQPEYVFFTLDKKQKARLVSLAVITQQDAEGIVYRAVDDAFDRIVVWDGQFAKIPERGILPNYFNKVPGRTNSNVLTYDSPRVMSSIAKIRELAMAFFNDDSTKSIAKKWQMYPKEWGLAIICPKCDGEKVKNGEECPACNGTGEKQFVGVAERISIHLNENSETGVPLPPGGYFVPPIDAWNAMNNELRQLEAHMNQTHWGTLGVSATNGMNATSDIKGQQETATNNLLSEKDKEPKLREYSEWAQDMEKFVTDQVGIVVYPGSYGGSSVMYGDRYLLETPDQLTEKYEKLRAQGSVASVLDTALIDLLEAKHASNPFQLRKNLLLMKVEPFVHYNAQVVMGWAVSDDVKAQKLFFGEWLATKTEMEIFSSTEEKLRADLDAFTKGKVVQSVEPKPAIAV